MKNVFLRIGIAFLFALTCFANVNTAFATESVPTSVNNDTVVSEGTTRATNAISGVVPSNSTATFTVHLDSYIGFSKEFVVNATSNSTTGGVLFIHLISPRGNEVSQDWIMSVNEIASWKVTLPSSGDWTVRISSNGTNAPVNVFMNWV